MEGSNHSKGGYGSVGHPPRSDDGVATPRYKLYARRWYLLFVFCLLSFCQCVIWITYSPIAHITEQYYDVDSAAVDLMLNWGPIIYCLVVIPVMIYSKKPGSGRVLLIVGGTLCAVGATARLIPVWIDGLPHTLTICLVHFGQILNAAVGPIVMSLPPKISSTWFADNERATATAIGVLANNAGGGVGFFAPFLVTQPDEMPRILYAQFVLAAVTIALILVYFPSTPPLPPSPAAEVMSAASHHSFTLKDAARDARLALTNWSFLAIAVFGGGIGGFSNAWSGSLDLLLPEPQFTSKTAGWVGFSMTCSTVIGGLVSGPIADRVPLFHRRLKLLICSILVLATASCVWISLALPFLGHAPILPSSQASCFISISAMGLFLGAINPLYYELGVELTFPGPELVSSGFISLANNIWALVFLFVFPIISTESVNILTAAGIAATGLVTACVHERYRRQEEEDKVRLGKDVEEATKGDAGVWKHGPVAAGSTVNATDDSRPLLGSA